MNTIDTIDDVTIGIYVAYNKRYQKITKWFDKPMRGIMHYKKTDAWYFYNTTLFGGEVKKINKQLLIWIQHTITQKIQKLQELQKTIRADEHLKKYSIRLFLDRNLEKATTLLHMLWHATLRIEASKAWYNVSKSHLETCYSLTLITQHTLLWKSLYSQPQKIHHIKKYMYSLTQKRPSVTSPLITSRLQENITDQETIRVIPKSILTKWSLQLEPKEVIYLLISCLQELSFIRHKSRVITLSYSENKKFDYLRWDITWLVWELQIVDKHVYSDEQFHIMVWKKWWQMGKNVLYVPYSWLSISLLKLAQIIDHEIGTHEITSYADGQLLNNRSHGYRKDEEWMAVFNQRMVAVNSPSELKKIPTHHHIWSLLGEYYGYTDLSKILYEFFLLAWEKTARARSLAKQTALKTKRYYPLESKWSNSFQLQYTNGYYNLLDLYRRSKESDINSFSLLWKRMHLWRFTTKDLQDIKWFLNAVDMQNTKLPTPIYFGRLLYQSFATTKSIEEIITEDIRYKRTGLPDAEVIKVLNNWCIKMKSIVWKVK